MSILWNSQGQQKKQKETSISEGDFFLYCATSILKEISPQKKISQQKTEEQLQTTQKMKEDTNDDMKLTQNAEFII